MTILPFPVQAEPFENPAVIRISSEGESRHAIVVQKSSQQLTVYSVGRKLEVVEQFSCSTGKQKGRKHTEGDAKTPSGTYFVTGEFLDKRLAEIYGTRAFPLDYPNALDLKRGRNGSAIWLHGTNKTLQPYQTNGCIAMDNQSIDALKSYIQFNKTPVIIVDSLSDISIAKEGRWLTAVVRLLKSRNTSLESGTYHDYLSAYHPDYLPDLTWWRPWSAFRPKGSLETPMDIESGGLLVVSVNNYPTVLFDQYLLWKGKKKSAGLLKLFLKPHETKWRISAEEYQTATITNRKGSTQASPILIAAQKFQDPMISDAEVASIIDSWLLGWSKKNIQEYSSYYSSQFISSKNQTLTEWIAYKKKLNLKYKYIEVTRKGLRIKRNKRLINATFMQYYKSDQFEGVTKKTLVFGLENGEWKILKEII